MRGGRAGAVLGHSGGVVTFLALQSANLGVARLQRNLQRGNLRLHAALPLGLPELGGGRELQLGVGGLQLVLQRPELKLELLNLALRGFTRLALERDRALQVGGGARHALFEFDSLLHRVIRLQVLRDLLSLRRARLGILLLRERSRELHLQVLLRGELVGGEPIEVDLRLLRELLSLGDAPRRRLLGGFELVANLLDLHHGELVRLGNRRLHRRGGRRDLLLHLGALGVRGLTGGDRRELGVGELLDGFVANPLGFEQRGVRLRLALARRLRLRLRLGRRHLPLRGFGGGLFELRRLLARLRGLRARGGELLLEVGFGGFDGRRRLRLSRGDFLVAALLRRRYALVRRALRGVDGFVRFLLRFLLDLFHQLLRGFRLGDGSLDLRLGFLLRLLARLVDLLLEIRGELVDARVGGGADLLHLLLRLGSLLHRRRDLRLRLLHSLRDGILGGGDGLRRLRRFLCLFPRLGDFRRRLLLRRHDAALHLLLLLLHRLLDLRLGSLDGFTRLLLLLRDEHRGSLLGGSHLDARDLFRRVQSLLGVLQFLLEHLLGFGTRAVLRFVRATRRLLQSALRLGDALIRLGFGLRGEPVVLFLLLPRDFLLHNLRRVHVALRVGERLLRLRGLRRRALLRGGDVRRRRLLGGFDLRRHRLLGGELRQPRRLR